MISLARLVLMLALTAFSLAGCTQADGDTSPTETSPATSDIVIGDSSAPVTLTEYASWTCPACLQFHTEVMPMLKQDYIETGKVKLIFREFPTSPAALSVAGFSIARCSGAENYPAALDALFAAQETILTLAQTGGDVEQALRSLAAAQGLAGDSFDTCLADETVRDAIITAVTQADAQGVSSTPTVFLNGRKLAGYDWRKAEGMRSILEAELEQLSDPE